MLCDVSYLNGLENPWLFHVSESLKIHVVEQFLECSGRCHGQAWLIYSFLQPMLCVWHYLSDSNIGSETVYRKALCFSFSHYNSYFLNESIR